MRREWWATALFFGANGAVYGSIFPRLPDIVDRYALTPGLLGLVLFVPVATSLVGSALGGKAVVRFGARHTSRLALLVLAVSLGLSVAGTEVAGLVIALGVLGMADGVMDVGMNMHAVDVEIRSGRTVLQGLHAAWTAGALAAAVASGVVAESVPLATHVAVAAGVLGVVGVVLPTWWEPVRTPLEPHPDGSARALGALALVAVGASVAESVPIDWASVFTAEVFSVAPSVAAAGTATALAGMFVGRVLGDRITDRLGPRRTLVAFSALSLLGGLMVMTAPASPVAFAGLAVTGMGSSVMFPGIISIAGRVSDGGVATVTAASRVGFMLAPVVTGAVAERFGFRPIMVLPGVAALGVGLWARMSPRVSSRGRPSA